MSKRVLGFDASSTLAPRTGVGRAALGLLRGIVALDDPGIELRVLMNSLTRRRGAEHAFLDAPNTRVVRRFSSGARMVRSWARGSRPTVEQLLGDGVDIFHGPASYMPPAEHARRIVSVYDLAFLDDPPEQRDALGGAYFAATFPKLLPACDLVVTASEFTRRRVIETYRLKEDRVVSVPLGVDHDVFKLVGERFVEMARQQIGLSSKTYLLALSDHTPRKRAGLLLDLYERLLEVESTTPPLVVLGWRGKPAAELRKRRALHRRVVVLPHLGDHLLPGLYTGAVATILTSQHEGFGLPVLEAQACGSPVVCARVTALPEVAGDGALFVDSNDPDAWVEAIRIVAFHQDARDAWSEKGRSNAARFSWETCARNMLDCYFR